MKVSTAVVLVGGSGIRLRPLTDDIPKGMILICGKPLLEWMIEWLRDNNVERVVLGVAYLKEKIMEYFGNGDRFGIDIKYSIHSVEGGTGEGFRLAISRYIKADVFFAMNGDQITDLTLQDVAEFHLSHNALATITAIHPPCPYGQVQFDNERNVMGFLEKPTCLQAYCSNGIYVFNREILHYLPERGNIEKTTFPMLAKERQLKVYPFQGFFTTINTRKDLMKAEQDLRKRKRE